MNDDFNTLSGILNSRYSCRAYLNDNVPDSDIKDVITTASRVPTWCNAQPWRVLVTKGDATKNFSDVLVKAAEAGPMQPDFDWPVQYTGEYQDRRRVCGYQLYDALGIQREDRERRADQMMKNYRFFGAPHVAIITTEADLGPYGAMDCGGFISAFTLVARSKGIASVVQASVTGFAPAIREHFDIPKHRLIKTAISFGYEDPGDAANNFRTERAEIDDVVEIFS